MSYDRTTRTVEYLQYSVFLYRTHSVLLPHNTCTLLRFCVKIGSFSLAFPHVLQVLSSYLMSFTHSTPRRRPAMDYVITASNHESGLVFTIPMASSQLQFASAMSHFFPPLKILQDADVLSWNASRATVRSSDGKPERELLPDTSNK